MGKKKETGKDKAKGEAPDVILEVLRAQNAGARRDTGVQKGRSQVSGGGKKPYRQKGTGRARQGTIRATQWRGGSKWFGQQFKNHTVKVNKKVRKAALRDVLKIFQANSRIVTAFPSIDKPSTKQFVAYLESNGVAGKTLFIYNAGVSEAVLKSARNLVYVECLHEDSIHLQALLKAEWVIIAAGTLERMVSAPTGKNKSEGAAA